MDIDLNEFPGNSKRDPPTEDPAEEVRPPLEKIVTTRVEKKDARWYDRLAETLFGAGESAGAIIGSLFQEIVVPAAKDMFVDFINHGIERAIYGEESRPGRRRSSRRDEYVPYDKASYKTERESSKRSITSGGSHDFDKLIIGSKREADEVLYRMREYADKYDEVTVSDFLELVGEPTSPIDRRWGWTVDTIQGARVLPSRGGHFVALPPTKRLD